MAQFYEERVKLPRYLLTRKTIYNVTRWSRWCADNHRRLMWNCQKTEFRGGHLQLRMGSCYACTIYQSFVPILVLLSQSELSIYQLSYFTIFFTMQTGSSYLQIIPLILNQFWYICVYQIWSKLIENLGNNLQINYYRLHCEKICKIWQLVYR